MKKIPKLSLGKKVVASLSKEEMVSIVGGERLTTNYTCGSECRSISPQCAIDYPPPAYTPTFPVSLAYCMSFEGPNDTCAPGQASCGTDANC